MKRGVGTMRTLYYSMILLHLIRQLGNRFRSRNLCLTDASTGLSHVELHISCELIGMINFSKQLKIDNKSLKFNFYGFDMSTGRRFLIVCRGGDVDTVFHMKRNGSGTWEVMTDAPDWVIKAQDKLSDVIEKNTYG
jgi:hypothetical protein